MSQATIQKLELLSGDPQKLLTRIAELESIAESLRRDNAALRQQLQAAATTQVPPAATTSSAPAPRLSAPRTLVPRSQGGGLYLSPGNGHWIKSKSDDGDIITLEDGSVWQVDPLDRIDTALWLPITDITVVESAGGDYLLINTDDGEKAHARLLHQ